MGEIVVAVPCSIFGFEKAVATSTVVAIELTPELAPVSMSLDDIPLDIPQLVSQLPIPPTPASPSASTALQFEDLPTEIHLLVLSQLDAIDATCLGLASRQMYTTYRRVHHKVPLNSRRAGRNKLEYVWNRHTKGATSCRFCGIHRCELYKHIGDFFPERYEYCHVRQVYGLKAVDGNEDGCFRCCPPQPTRCGRHIMTKLATTGVEVSRL